MICPKCGKEGGVVLFTSVAPCDKCAGFMKSDKTNEFHWSRIVFEERSKKWQGKYWTHAPLKEGSVVFPGFTQFVTVTDPVPPITGKMMINRPKSADYVPYAEYIIWTDKDI